jgi:hypothetical protein
MLLNYIPMISGWDKYDRQARVYPTILVLIPFFVLQYYYLNKEFADWSNFVTSLRTVAVFSIPVVLFYFINDRVQFLSKILFESRLFKGGSYFPTTDFLLYSNDKYSTHHKKLIRDKIKTDFNIKMPSKLDEENDEQDARRRIAEAVNFVRKKSGRGRFVLDKNINYGFSRNLVGGSLIGMVLAAINVVVFYYLDFQQAPLVISSICLFIYFIIVLTSRATITFFGNEYASKLYDEYVSST